MQNQVAALHAALTAPQILVDTKCINLPTGALMQQHISRVHVTPMAVTTEDVIRTELEKLGFLLQQVRCNLATGAVRTCIPTPIRMADAGLVGQRHRQHDAHDANGPHRGHLWLSWSVTSLSTHGTKYTNPMSATDASQTRDP